MKTFALLLALAIPASAQRHVHVRSSITRNGEYRQSHARSYPNRTRFDNYSTRGNTNPFTGSKGHRKAYK
jgi:hypothetical protein